MPCNSAGNPQAFAQKNATNDTQVILRRNPATSEVDELLIAKLIRY